ncbi:MAG: hypothetical protein GF334_03560, partial [Candidatus Altiarchaeales archaeon]|nr:hypothetical protein [Candidatus Altiarchaeales archaeon]
MRKQAPQVFKVSFKGGEPDLKELSYDSETKQYLDEVDGVSNYLRFQGLGSSLENLSAAKAKARRKGAPVYVLRRDDEVVELLPELAPLGGLERASLGRVAHHIKLFDELEEQIMGPSKDGGVHAKVISFARSGDSEKFRKAIQRMPFRRLCDLSDDLSEFEGPESAQKIALEVLGKTIPSDAIPNVHLRGIVAKHGFERILGAGGEGNLQTDLDFSLAGKSPSETHELRDGLTRKIADTLSRLIGESSSPEKLFEDRVILENASQVVAAYTQKWVKLNELINGYGWRSQGDKRQFIESFIFSKDYFAKDRRKKPSNGNYALENRVTHELGEQ